MIVEFLKGMVDRMDDTRCGGDCWRFIYARKDYANNMKQDRECCVHFILEDFSAYTFYEDTGILRQPKYVDYEFKAFVGKMSTLDIQWYNEGDGDVYESKFEKHVRPIIECMGTPDQEYCLQESLEIVDWRYRVEANRYADNFDGIFVTGKLRRWILAG